MPKQPSARSAPLSAKAVAALKATSFVGGVPGLQLVISAGGTRSWRLFYRIAGGGGVRRGISLGRYPGVSLADARRRGAEALALAANGEDPKTARVDKVARALLTVERAVAQYLLHCQAANDAKTVADKASAFRTHLPREILQRPLAHLRKPEVIALLDGLSDRPAIHRNLFAYLRHFFGWALERSLVDVNPLQGVKPPRPVPPRERTLTDDELRRLWRAQGTMAEIAKLSILTCQRRGSIEKMMWTDVELDRAVWLVPGPNMKSARPHAVPLSSEARKIIDRQLRRSGPYIFGVRSDGAKPYGGASNGSASIKRQIGVDDIRPHDLRRTGVTLAQRRGVNLETIEALTQHKIARVVGVYARYGYHEEKRHAVDMIEIEVISVLKSG